MSVIGQIVKEWSTASGRTRSSLVQPAKMLLSAYDLAVREGEFPKFNPREREGLAVVKHIASTTGIEYARAFGFASALKNLADRGEIPRKYFSPALAAAVRSAKGERIKAGILSALDPALSILKPLAGALAAGALVVGALALRRFVPAKAVRKK